MTQTTPRGGRDLSKIALQVATEASRLVLAGFRQNPTVSYKAHEEPYTEFDVQSEQLIRQRLAELTPEIPVVGEEQGGQASGELTWYCDPIDGTVNFMRGQPFFAVSLGVSKNGAPFAALYPEDDGYPTTAPVGKFEAGKSRFGPYDVAGNVWEWVADWYAPYTADAKTNPKGPDTGEKKVIRGGAWNGSFASWLRPSFRFSQDPSALVYGVGFRCVADL